MRLRKLYAEITRNLFVFVVLMRNITTHGVFRKGRGVEAGSYDSAVDYTWSPSKENFVSAMEHQADAIFYENIRGRPVREEDKERL